MDEEILEMTEELDNLIALAQLAGNTKVCEYLKNAQDELYWAYREETQFNVDQA